MAATSVSPVKSATVSHMISNIMSAIAPMVTHMLALPFLRCTWVDIDLDI